MKKIINIISIKVFEYIYKKQEEHHKKRMGKLNKKVLSAKMCNKKIHTTNAATLTIKDDSDKDFNQEKIEKLVEKYIQEPQKFFDYIKRAKTPIYKIKNADILLAKIGEEEGFILPKKGLKALYLNLFLTKKISFSTPEMFVVRGFDVNIYAFLYQFYNWYCYKNKLSGFEVETQEKFKHIFEICETNKINNLSYEEIINLKSAIKRDIEAINFVKKIVLKFATQKRKLEKIKNKQIVHI